VPRLLDSHVEYDDDLDEAGFADLICGDGLMGSVVIQVRAISIVERACPVITDSGEAGSGAVHLSEAEASDEVPDECVRAAVPWCTTCSDFGRNQTDRDVASRPPHQLRRVDIARTTVLSTVHDSCRYASSCTIFPPDARLQRCSTYPSSLITG